MSISCKRRFLVLFGLGALPALLASCNSASGAAPAVLTDEVAFDHSIHAGQYGMACLTCHAFADKSAVAGIPSINKCMGCHSYAARDKEGVKLMAAKFKKKQAVSWIRVHELPDFVYFSHRMHINAKVACSDCHGAVEKMKGAQRVSSLSMGWCMDCHKAKGASLDCLACHK